MRQLKSLCRVWLSVCYVNIKIMTCRNRISPFPFYGCVTWSLISKEEGRMRVFISDVQGKILGLRGNKSQESGRGSLLKIHVVCAVYKL
jgi:hypothetical protein